MSFKPYAYRTGMADSWEYLEVGALGEVQVGMAMIAEGGKLALASGAEKPTYISMYAGEVAESDIIPVIRVNPDTRFATTFSVAADAVAVGDKLTIAADSLQVTATTGGCFEVTEASGTQAGDEVIGRFVEGGAA